MRWAVVLAGGVGSRFWPLSTAQRPKQLLPLASGGRTLLGATFERALRVVDRDHVLVMTSSDLREACQRECPGARVLGEPVARNTAAAIAAAAAWFGRNEGDPAFAVMPADHAIDDTRAFRDDLERGFTLAEREAVLVTFGIRPTQAEVNFGYIRRGSALAERLHRVAQFTEKPDRERAAAWIASGDYAWNSGLFVWRVSTFRRALEAGRPAIAEGLAPLDRATNAEEFDRAMAATFPGVESISVDYAVLERAPNVLVLEAGFDWDDLGSWGAWARRQPRDERGNVLFGDAIAIDCDRCVVVADGGTAAAMGLSDMVVVHAGGATLSCRLEESDRVRLVSEAVRARSTR